MNTDVWKERRKRAGLVAIGLIAGIAVASIWARFTQPAPDPDEGDMSPMPRMPDMEALASEILAKAGLHNNIRIYLDTHNPFLCAYSYPQLRTIVLTKPCGSPLRIDGRLNWQTVHTLGHELGHVLNGHKIGARLGAGVEWQEVQANEFSGWAMHQLGATLIEAQRASAPKGVSVRNVEPKNLEAIEHGWRSQ